MRLPLGKNNTQVAMIFVLEKYKIRHFQTFHGNNCK